MLTTFLAVLLSAFGAAASPQVNPWCVLDGERYGVEFLRQGLCCPNRLEFAVQDKVGGGIRSLRIEASIARLNSVRVVARSKLVASGRVRRDGHLLLVADLEANALEDEIWSRDYRFSPSGRRIVYTTMPPEGSSPEAHDPILLVYDLAAGRAANRAGRPAVLDRSNAGIPVFPEANAAAGSYDPALSPPHRYLSPFLWSEDETRIVFFGFSRGAYSLVTVDLGPGHAAPKIARRSVSPREFRTAEGPAGPGGRIPVVGIEWHGEGSVRLKTTGQGGLKESVVLALPLPPVDNRGDTPSEGRYTPLAAARSLSRGAR